MPGCMDDASPAAMLRVRPGVTPGDVRPSATGGWVSLVEASRRFAFGVATVPGVRSDAGLSMGAVASPGRGGHRGHGPPPRSRTDRFTAGTRDEGWMPRIPVRPRPKCSGQARGHHGTWHRTGSRLRLGPRSGAFGTLGAFGAGATAPGPHEQVGWKQD
jgi:hypothetical protein